MSDDIYKWADGQYTLMFDEHTFFVWDNEKDERMTALEVTKKLNELNEKNNCLCSNFNILVSDMDNMSKRNVELWEKIAKLQEKEKK